VLLLQQAALVQYYDFTLNVTSPEFLSSLAVARIYPVAGKALHVKIVRDRDSPIYNRCGLLYTISPPIYRIKVSNEHQVNVESGFETMNI
jgi:hypothetical protein